jgi:hypothetical protein
MRKKKCWLLRLFSSLLALVILLPTTHVTMALEPELVRVYARIRKDGSNFTGVMMTVQAPAQDYAIPGVQPSGCVYYPLWIGYSNYPNWVEIGLGKCRGGPVTDPAGYYHVYGYWKTPDGRGDFLTSQINDLVPTGGTATLGLQKKADGRTWQWIVNGVVRAERGEDAWTGITTDFEIGVEGHSPAFAPRDARAFNITFQQGVGTAYHYLDGWTPFMDNNPEHYGIWKNNNQWYDVSMGGTGVFNRLGWVGPDTFGIGQKNMGVLLYDNGLTAIKYGGEIGIDAVQYYTGADGQTNPDLWGYHQSDRAEYLLKIPANPFSIALIAVADVPGPVILNLYVDGAYVGQTSIDNNDNSRHLRIVPINIPGIFVQKAHAFAFEFANDFYQGGGANGDRNMLLDTVGVVSCVGC